MERQRRKWEDCEEWHLHELQKCVEMADGENVVKVKLRCYFVLFIIVFCCFVVPNVTKQVVL